MISQISRFGFLIASAAIIVSGCGGRDSIQRGAVVGTVTVDGQVVEVGAITFVPTGSTQGPTAGAKIMDGKYEIDALDGPVFDFALTAN